MKPTEKRSHSHGTARSLGVGARQDTSQPPAQGGGYLDTYRFCELEKSDYAAEKIDPRLKDLHQIGLNPTLLKVAAAIGVDNFLKMWEILDNDEHLRTDWGGIMVKIRAFKSYRRYLRNRHIVMLHKNNDGVGMTKIAKKATENLGERIHPSQIYKIVAKSES